MSSITSEVVDSLAAIVLGEEHRPFAPLQRPVESVPELRQLAGTYRFGPDFYVPEAEIRLIEQQGQLLVPAEGTIPEGGLIPLAAGRFLHRQHWFEVTFERDEESRVTAMQYGAFRAE